MQSIGWFISTVFKEKQYRFRTARRLLIGSAEDGHSLAVMEEIGRKFWTLCKPTADLIDLVAEAIRICKLPNWWHPDSGGLDYIYQSLIGQRTWFYKVWGHSLTALQDEIGRAIAEQNRAIVPIENSILLKKGKPKPRQEGTKFVRS